MKDDEKQLFERINSYCSYGVLVITICFCALIYWGNQQLSMENEAPKADNRNLYQNNTAKPILIHEASVSSTSSQH